MNWPALAAARAHDPALQNWPAWLHAGDTAVTLIASEADTALATINAQLREQGLVRGWRDEPFAIFSLDDGSRLARTERAAARFWGTLTLAAHANGYVPGPDGRPTHLWIARRAFDKATDPGLFDSLVGGGVPDGQTPHEALLREGWEEAGQREDVMRSAMPGRVLRLQRDIPEGLQLEDLHVWDLALPEGVAPHNQDGEVQAFSRLPLDEALALAAGDTMTVDAALVTLDFALRHGLLAAPAGAEALFDTP